MKRSIVMLSLCCFFSPAWSADLRGKYTDYAAPTCKDYLEALARVRKKRDEDPLDAQYQRSWGWIAGYLTSYNTNVPDTYDIIGDRPARQQLAVEVYCKEHPGDNFDQMMRARTKELYFLRQRQKPVTDY
jgi:hypothetical protein